MKPLPSPLLKQPNTVVDCYPVLQVAPGYKWGGYNEVDPFMYLLINRWYEVRLVCDLPRIIQRKPYLRAIGTDWKYLNLPPTP